MSSPTTFPENQHTDKKAAMEELFKSRLHRFYKQLTTGYRLQDCLGLILRCGKEGCDGLFCFSNPGIGAISLLMQFSHRRIGEVQIVCHRVELEGNGTGASAAGLRIHVP